MPDQIPSVPREPGTWVTPVHMWVVAIFLVVAAVSVTYLSPAMANSDYICTKIVTSSGGCTNGTWSAWQQVSQSSQGGITTTLQQRTYTGTRAVSQTLSYLNLRTACQAGYTQQVAGQRLGNSGNQGRGGDITTQYSACQITESQTTTASSGGSSVSFQAAQTDTGTSTTTTAHVQSVDQLGTGSGSGVGVGGAGLANATGTLTVKPALVKSGTPTKVSWNVSGVESCDVTGSNGDEWSGATTGAFDSSPIIAHTRYSLVCPLGDGESLTSQASVDIIPTFQEQ